MNLRCLSYRALDRFRRSWIATRTVYGGVPVQTIRARCTVTGIVQSVPEHAEDGDLTFGLRLTDGTFRHCEVTPCASDATKAAARALTVGQRILVSGEERFDPKHFGNEGGWLELHPIVLIEVLG